MARKTTLDDEAPKRGEAGAVKNLNAQRTDSEMVTLNNKVPAHLRRYLQKLALDKGCEQRELIIEALEGLKTKYGEI